MEICYPPLSKHKALIGFPNCNSSFVLNCLNWRKTIIFFLKEKDPPELNTVISECKDVTNTIQKGVVEGATHICVYQIKWYFHVMQICIRSIFPIVFT